MKVFRKGNKRTPLKFDFPALSLLAKNSQQKNVLATFQSRHLKDETLKIFIHEIDPFKSFQVVLMLSRG